MKEFHYIYKVTNMVNGMYYIGKHSTNNIDDNYFGSGNLLLKAFKKYNRRNFKKEIIQFCDTEREAFKLEAKLVTTDIVKDRKSYNIIVGGMGMQKGGKLSNETKEKIRIAHTGRIVSIETRKRSSESRVGIKLPQKVKDNMSKSKLRYLESHLPNRSKKIMMIDKGTGVELRSFNSASDANVFVGRNRGSDGIAACARGYVSNSAGFNWKYID